jgi:DNA-binding PadR family transcriptional regulator
MDFEEYYKNLQGKVNSAGGDSGGDFESYYNNLRMDIGDIPDTRPKPKLPTMEEKVNVGIRPSMNIMESPLMQQVNNFQTDPGAADSMARDQLRPGRDLPIIGTALRGLDAFSENETVEKGASFMRSLYTPGASAANIAGFAGSIGAGLSKVAPQLGNSLAGRVVQKGVEGAAVGAVEGAGQSLASGNPSLEDAGEQALWGSAFGGGLGAAAPLVGSAYRRFRPEVGTPSAAETPILSLPEGRTLEQRIVAAQSRGDLTPNSDPVATPYTFRLNEPSEQTVRSLNNVGEAKSELTKISNDIRDMETRYNQAVNDQFKFLKQSMADRGGVVQGQLIRDAEGAVTGRVGRISNNPQWYRDFYAATGRKPTNKELYELAKKQIDEGYQDESGFIPSWKQENAYDDTLSALNQVRGDMRQAVKEQGLGLTDATLKSTELGFKRNAAEPLPVQQAPKVLREMQQAPRQQSADLRTPPKATENGMRERGFVSTLKASDKPDAGLKERLKAMYTPLSNEESVRRANLRIDRDIEEAVNYVTNSRVITAEHVTTAHRLIDTFQQQGNYTRAVEIAERIAEAGTRAGQSIQAFSIYNRLTPQGVLVHAKRVAEKVNQKLPVSAKPVEVTADTVAQLTDLATTMQTMTGVKSVANDVMSILERAKAGQTLTDTETQTIKQFVQDARKFVKNVEPMQRPPRQARAPKEMQDKRVRDNVLSFLEAQEKAAKDRLKAKGIQVSSLPLDIYADYALIGATKLAKGTIKFADWSEEMVKELGENIRPYLAQLYEKAQEALDLSAKAISSKTISDAERITNRVIKSKNLTADDAKTLQELAQEVSKLSGDAKIAASQDLQVVLNRLERPGFLQKVSTTQTMMQLLNPKTLFARNPLGNELFYRLERLNKYVTTPIDIARSTITKGERTVTFRTNNQGEYWKNWVKGWQAGWKGVNPEGLTTQFDISGQSFNGKWNPMTYMEKFLGASLKSFDYAAYRRAVNETLGEMATLRAMNEGLKGPAKKEAIQKYIREADENLLRIADEYGKYITFQDNNLISVGLQKFKRGLNLGKDWGVGDLVIKYPKTPGALLMRALEYSPIGVLRSAKIAFNPWLKKDPNTREAMHALSRAITGTMGMTALGWFLAEKGILTGSASKDRDIRALEQSAGQGQYQVNITALKRWFESGFNPDAAKIKENDLLYSYDWAQPVAIAVSMGANISENMKEKKKKAELFTGALGTAYKTAEGGLNTLVEQSVLQGVRRAVEGYPGHSVTDKMFDIGSDIPASFAPTLGNQVKQATDNAKRETYDPDKLQAAVNRLKVKVPGWAQTLPQQYDTLGKPKETYQNNSLFNVFLNPGFASRYKLTPEAKLVVDLINTTGDTSAAPRVPGKDLKIKVNGETQTVQLSTEQFARLQRLTGEETTKQLSRIDPSKSNESKLNSVIKALSEAGEKARATLKKEMGVK